MVEQLLQVLSAGASLLPADQCVDAPISCPAQTVTSCLHVWSRSLELYVHTLRCSGVLLCKFVRKF